MRHEAKAEVPPVCEATGDPEDDSEDDESPWHCADACCEAAVDDAADDDESTEDGALEELSIEDEAAEAAADQRTTCGFSAAGRARVDSASSSHSVSSSTRGEEAREARTAEQLQPRLGAEERADEPEAREAEVGTKAAEMKEADEEPSPLNGEGGGRDAEKVARQNASFAHPLLPQESPPIFPYKENPPSLPPQFPRYGSNACSDSTLAETPPPTPCPTPSAAFKGNPPLARDGKVEEEVRGGRKQVEKDAKTAHVGVENAAQKFGQQVSDENKRWKQASGKAEMTKGEGDEKKGNSTNNDSFARQNADRFPERSSLGTKVSFRAANRQDSSREKPSERVGGAKEGLEEENCAKTTRTIEENSSSESTRRYSGTNSNSHKPSLKQ